MTTFQDYDEFDFNTAFDDQLMNALSEYHAVHPRDAQVYLQPEDVRSWDHVKKERHGIKLVRIKGKYYWRAWRYHHKNRQDKTMRCQDDHDPGSMNDRSYHELFAWSYKGS